MGEKFLRAEVGAVKLQKYPYILLGFIFPYTI
jgi:hypothetical protein